MLLVEADGKALLRSKGIPVPDGIETATAAPDLAGKGPWIVKAQVPIGGRGKAGGIVRCETPGAVNAALGRLLGSRLKAYPVETCLIEQAVAGTERYLSIMVDAAGYGLRVMYAADGGIDVEQSDSIAGIACPPHPAAVNEALNELLQGEPPAWRNFVSTLGRGLAELVLDQELILAEINPLFVSDAGCIAADAKLVIDLNAIGRRPELAALVARRPDVYADAQRKLKEGFDYIELDPDGEIGLVTTGAGLSMMLVDELTGRGLKPLNFCDIRTGQMRGSPARLIRVLEWITSHASLKAVLVNIFAGITDLSEFGRLLSEAIVASPNLKVPVIARLVGRNAAEAQRFLQQAQPGMLVTEDLSAALAKVGAVVGARP
ncbi:MAG TPA: ATP-grasp domain-containing protein [Rhodopila sp.]|uniref:ATP-grasp domain-containing protein n=1 Tax=Rhodopila sp. TaxID=2480087 RepID=UPI002BE140A6|nr:ATP-grasp domain-containing protein [Rhodopila sp.]HVY16880.1 ATP-grasp domain-containing protein [Rhodopila sp.]